MSEFVDRAQLHARAGNGGAGAISFRREAHVDKGGPDGGDGGDGGSVFLISSTSTSSLIGFRDHPFRRAEDGAHGSGKRKTGADGEDLIVNVPVGTVVKDLDGEVIADLGRPGLKICITRGGRGGKGNAGFLSNRRRAPAFAEQGETGEELWFNLELKLAADISLVGFPNVGKSSTIAAISRARPKVANYPFTTLIPTLGVVRRGSTADTSEMVVADIPGLIEGASSGKGLGYEFLRHIERSRVLAFVLDVSPVSLGGPSIYDQAVMLQRELETYLPDLATRPRVVVGNKADIVPDRDEVLEELKVVSGLTGALSYTLISTVTRENLDELVNNFFVALRSAEEESHGGNVEEVILHRPGPRYEFSVSRLSPSSFTVGGRDAVHAVRLSDLESLEALAIVQHRLDRMGVIKALKKLGIREGDEVTVGDLTFVYEDSL